MVQSDRPHHLLPPRSASDPNQYRRSDRDRRERKRSLTRPAPSPIQKFSPLDSNDDKASLHSASSNGSSGNVQTADVLRGVTGDRVRHGQCAPEFLEAIAVRGDKHLKILTGTEASTFFLSYLGRAVGSKIMKPRQHGQQRIETLCSQFTAYERGRKCVDYYMTWRRKNSHHETVTEIDEEFRRVSRRIDSDFKAFRKAGGAPSSTTSRSSRKRDRSRSPSSAKKSRPEALSVTAEDTAVVAAAEDLPAPPASATDSVISLPYLNMVRGVPRAHRVPSVPLFIANPDRLSTYSELESPLDTPTAFNTEETVKTAKPIADGPFVIAITPPDTKNPNGGNDEAERSGLMKSSASIRSTGTHSSRSSRSSRESGRESGHSSVNHSPTSQYDAGLPLVQENWKFDYLIVLLGDKFQKEGLTWHGLERQSSSRTQHRSRAKEPSSPWFGTLNKTEPSTPVFHGALQPQQQLHLQQVQRSKSMMAAVPTDDEGDRWADSAPVVPLRPMLDAMGFVPSPAPKDHLALYNGYTPHSPVIPLGMPYPHTPQHYSTSVAGTSDAHANEAALGQALDLFFAERSWGQPVCSCLDGVTPEQRSWGK
ncbi:hypothetical protein BKA70DRAFT_1220218 [Coprinopsis sp. MPI-PUGE-AT-0042]|nr:hypothetical protein BKA70DRAFT_1220218 [Coprinopsis sp. MPI-PUGE-AT-0042]